MIQQKVSVWRAIDAARRKLGLREMNEDWPDFVEWVWEGETKIGSSITYERKECVLDVVDGCADVPKDYLWLMGITYNDKLIEPSQADFQLFGNGIAGNTVSEPMASPTDAYHFLDRLYGFFGTNGVKFSIHNGQFRFSGVSSAQIPISYKGICIDENGFPTVNDDHTDALSQYLVYMHTYRQYLQGNLPEHMYRNTQRDWWLLCRQARADDEYPDAISMRVLKGIWNNLLPLPDLNNF